MSRQLPLALSSSSIVPSPSLETVVEYIPAKDWPKGQQIALLNLRKGDLCFDVMTHFRSRGVPAASYADYKALVASRHATTKPNGFHQITPTGVAVADDLARTLARENNLHYFTADWGNRYQAVTRCTCGWSASFQKGRSTQSNIYRAQGRHIASVEGLNAIATVLVPTATHVSETQKAET